MAKILPGCRVKLAFRLALADGTEIDAASADDPLELLVGDGTISPGLEFTFQGMQAGEKGRFEIAPGTAFPMPDPDKVFVLPAEDLGADFMPEQGQFIEFELPSGETTVGRFLEWTDEGLKMDFNHPLAGFPLIFEVHILDVQC
jgi:FKBP-type peptidyl-prolyl cis-trans isomerase SlpA